MSVVIALPPIGDLDVAGAVAETEELAVGHSSGVETEG